MYKEKILSLLRMSGTEFLSGESLARTCGISRTMVWKHIKSLEREGFGVEAVPSQGYRIISVPDLLRESEVRQKLKTKTIGREIILLNSTGSTNRTAMEMAAQGGNEGLVVAAETQSGGKGRLGRTWISPKGNLYFSIVLRPEIPVHKAPLITLMGAVAVALSIRSACSVDVGIKWPNDILVSGKKIAGLLTEMSAEQDRIRHIVLGIGINVNMPIQELPEDLQITTTTVAREMGRTMDRTALFREVLRKLDRWYRVFLLEPERILKEWSALNITVGHQVVIQGIGEFFNGHAQGIDSEGRLIVRLDSGEVRQVAAGDVTILKKQGK